MVKKIKNKFFFVIFFFVILFWAIATYFQVGDVVFAITNRK